MDRCKIVGDFMKAKLLLLLLVPMMLLSSTKVLAYSDSSGNIKNLTDDTFYPFDPLSWNQSNTNIPLNYLQNRMLDGSSGKPFPQAADLIYVYTFLALKTGTKPMGYIPSYANADLYEKHAYANGVAHLGAEGIFSNGWHANLADTGSQLLQGDIGDIKELWNKGHLIVLQVKYPDYTAENPITHFLAIDSIESNGDIYIFDSVNPSLKFSDAYKDSDIVSYIDLSSESAKSTELPKLWQKRDSENLFSEDGKSSVGAFGGGGFDPNLNKKLEKETKSSSSTAPSSDNSQSLGKFSTRDTSPVEDSKFGNKAPKPKKKRGFKSYLVVVFALIILTIGGVSVWIYKKKRTEDIIDL